jgi:replicative DNA helicase
MATQDATQLPPSDLQAERAVIGAVLFDSRCLDQIIAVVAADDFYLAAHQNIFAAMLKLGDAGSTGIDALTVSAELERRGQLEEIGGDNYLLKILGETIHAGHAKNYAGIVADKSRLRQLLYATSDIQAGVFRPHADAKDILQAGADRIMKLLERQTGSNAESMALVAMRSIDRLATLAEFGITLGFKELDDLLYGAKPGQLILIAARPSVGKSALAGGIMFHVARKHPVFFASLEMTSDELFDRGLCSRLGISLGELRPFARDKFSSAAVDEARQALSVLPIIIDDATDQTVQSIAAQARIIQRRQGLGLIIVDYLQLVTPANKRDPREQQVGGIAWGLKCLAKNLGVPVIALAQLNREIEKRPDKSPKLSDIRESGAIEQHSSVIVFLDRPGQWDPDKHDEDEAVLYVAKNRGGKTGKIDLKWTARSATFTDPDLQSADGLDLPDIDFGP